MEAYLDNSATTMAYPEVGELVYKVMCRDYGNPSSMHRKGVDAEHYVTGYCDSGMVCSVLRIERMTSRWRPVRLRSLSVALLLRMRA